MGVTKTDHQLILCSSCRRAVAPLEDNLDYISDVFNETHSIVQQGGKVWVCERETDHKENTGYTFSAVPQKRQLYANLNFPFTCDPDHIKYYSR